MIKRFFSVLLATACFSFVTAQEITGTWQGTISAGGVKLRFVMHLKNASGVYIASFDSPDQQAFNIPATKTTVLGDSVIAEIASMRGGYTGKWNQKDSITGVFMQGAARLPLVLLRSDNAVQPPPVVVKPQTPKPPFPYQAEDISYTNADKSVRFGATLTKPQGPGTFPAVILISGSGSQDRDGGPGPHKTYAVLADYLTRQGLAVLRIDDRGMGKSELGSDIDNITTETISRDIEAGLDYLFTRSDIDKKRTGLIGHSEGGMIAPMLAAKRKDIAFIVLLAAPGIKCNEIWNYQMQRNFIRPGLNAEEHAKAAALLSSVFNMFMKSTGHEEIRAGINTVYTQWKAAVPDSTEKKLLVVPGVQPYLALEEQMKAARALKWLNYFLNYDPAVNLSKIKIPVLALNGEYDTQVTPNNNLPAIQAALQKAGNNHYTVKKPEAVNHLFQTSWSPMAEYDKIEETFSVTVLEEIGNWIKKTTQQ
ncbi:alpha/beta hydrolase family protein [Sediminibacterium ginsengisoli]|uniref:Serine aminopeptidase S33 domain-containing protein n=1 Tax=Sediminibacterium ginsengisoli TaxID=413434 RepID=A0A1T4JSG8_9BACT|nr:alpha/beta fold hydrolase [Sediminibacterium ginsengisoli]SJZ33126.1 hypothetical protein SAMN04488132_101145 [Sediminibacterium ginsengisoli]